MKGALLVAVVAASMAAAQPPQAPTPQAELVLRQAPNPPQAPEVRPQRWPSPLEFPAGMERFEPSKATQWIAVVNGADAIRRANVRDTPAKWHQSGGMAGVEGVRSDKYRLVNDKPKEWIGNIGVRNGFGSIQQNRGLRRSYADGTRFDDVLSYNGKPFEHRMRVKLEGEWSNAVIWKNEAARPPGYVGLKVACASCHNLNDSSHENNGPGSGGYAAGLAPGGDTVVSDPLPWHLIGHQAEDAPTAELERFEPSQQFMPSYGGSGFSRGRGGRRR